MEGAASQSAAGFEAARAVADAILYEGYLLYPYRRSSGKNQIRWQFGVLSPPAWARAHGLDDANVAGAAESWWQQTECLLQTPGPARVRVRVRFLHLRRRCVEELTPEGTFAPVGALEAAGRTELTFDEAEPCEFDAEADVAELLTGERRVHLAAPAQEEMEPLADGGGRLVGRVRRRRAPVRATLAMSASACDGADSLVRLRLRVENAVASLEPAAPRSQALAVSLLATHVLAAAEGGEFLSLLEPPPWAARHARDCACVHAFPVLVGEPGRRDLVLSSPVLLYDHPQVSPESQGDLHDATEIDEILSLRTLTLTDAEKLEARATDPRAAQILDLVEGMPPEDMARLHGAIRSAGAGGGGGAAADDDGVAVAGVRVVKGSRVRLRPRRRGADAQDMFLDGRTARIEAVLTDLDGERQFAVALEDDPGAELDQWYGRFRYFSPDEVEPRAGEAGPRRHP